MSSICPSVLGGEGEIALLPNTRVGAWFGTALALAGFALRGRGAAGFRFACFGFGMLLGGGIGFVAFFAAVVLDPVVLRPGLRTAAARTDIDRSRFGSNSSLIVVSLESVSVSRPMSSLEDFRFLPDMLCGGVVSSGDNMTLSD